MRHNKFIGWEKFLGVVESVQKFSPWLSRQIAKRASEWPFWYSGLTIQEWNERQVHVHLPHSFRNTVDGEISQGHLVLGAELSVRLVLLRLRQEFPFKYQLRGVQGETHHDLTQAVDFKFGLTAADWEKIRMALARETRVEEELVVSAQLADGRSAGQFTFKIKFEMEKLLTSSAP